MYNKVKKEMTEYYRKMDIKDWMVFEDKEVEEKFRTKYQQIFDEMNAFYKKNPSLPNPMLKSKIHTLMAEYCEPIIFLENPFFFELDYNHSRSRGLMKNTPAFWLTKTKDEELMESFPFYKKTTDRYEAYYSSGHCTCGFGHTFDPDHNTLGYAKLFSVGMRGIMDKVKAKLALTDKNSEKYAFYSSIIESVKAQIKIANKFADKAEKLLDGCANEQHRKNLTLIRDTARRIPEFPPETFYEGLAMILFVRETIQPLENLAISQLGHVDSLLYPLYENDLKNGRITEEEARRLISIWMMHTDVKFDVEHNPWPETSACIELGGCDADGRSVFNEVTKFFVEEHHRLNLVNPKLCCRYSESSPEEYLKLIGKSILGGHGSFALLNDDVIIGELVANEVELPDARMYVSGGCTETMIEGFGHTEGAAIYFSLPKIFEDFFMGIAPEADIIPAFDGACSYEEFYEKCLAAFSRFFNAMLDQRNLRQSFYKNAISAPLFSSMQEGCIESGTDYAQGGAKYNFSTVAFVGIANVVDSLYSIKRLVYDEKRLTLEEFKNILTNNYEGHEALREYIIGLPKYGHNEKEPDAIAKRFMKDATDVIKSKKNERGGIYLASMFAYKFNRVLACSVGATPDGRLKHDYFANSCAPSTIKPIKDITKPLKTMNTVDYGVCGGGVAVLDLLLPYSKNFTLDDFSAFLRASCKLKCVTLQPNMVTLNELLDAKVNPEKHKNLTVRVCGLSARFVALDSAAQDEFIQRNFYTSGI